ncbi:hypothetical protein Tco_0716917 [Tanacetum coccineum]
MCKGKYAVSFLMDSAYLEVQNSNLQMSSFKLQNTCRFANLHQVDSFLWNYMSNNILHVHPTQTAQATAQEKQGHDNYQNDDASPEGENSAKRQKIFEHVPDDKISQELVEEMSGEIDEAKLQKAHERKVDFTNFKEESTSCSQLPKRCKSSTIDSDESRPIYLKHGNLGPKKYTLSLHKFPAILFPDDDMEERTSRWVNKRLKKFNVYAKYSMEHWKDMRAKQYHIRRQKQLRDKPHEVYLESKIVEIIRTTYELGHEHKFIKKIIGKIDPITEPDYKYLNKNDTEDMYLLCINDKVKNHRETGLLGSLVVFISDTKPYIKLRSSRSVHWDQQVVSELVVKL